MRHLVLFAFVLIPLSACGGGDSHDPAIDTLPGLVPTFEEVRAHFPDRTDEPIEVEGGFWQNSDVSISDDPLLRYGASVDDLEDRGRVTGYRANYFVGERNTFRGVEAGVTVIFDLFQDDGQAEAEVARLPANAYRSDAEANVGDQALAWSNGLWTSPEGIEPQCPCSFRFRVGRIVGYIRVWYNRPYAAPPLPRYGAEFDPDELALARAIAESMRTELAGS
jgi:hypothetical protein